MHTVDLRSPVTKLKTPDSIRTYQTRIEGSIRFYFHLSKSKLASSFHWSVSLTFFPVVRTDDTAVHKRRVVSSAGKITSFLEASIWQNKQSKSFYLTKRSEKASNRIECLAVSSKETISKHFHRHHVPNFLNIVYDYCLVYLTVITVAFHMFLAVCLIFHKLF
jgi:hypothetical protein